MGAGALLRQSAAPDAATLSAVQMSEGPLAYSLSQSRFGDQTFDRRRITGIVVSILVHVAVITALLVQWTISYRKVEPTAIHTFNVAPPTAPPEVTPEPEKVEPQPAPIPVKPQIIALEPPKLIVPSANIIAPPPLPQRTVETHEATPPAPPPPAPQPSSNAKPTWEGKVLAQLNKHRRYPRDAHFARKQGVPYIRFVMNREGKVLSSRLERSSGVPSLDNEAVALPKRAQPLPKPPEDMPGDSIELVVPVEFFIR
jgi:protein TonB